MVNYGGCKGRRIATAASGLVMTGLLRSAGVELDSGGVMTQPYGVRREMKEGGWPMAIPTGYGIGLAD